MIDKENASLDKIPFSPLDPGGHLAGLDMARLLPLHATSIDSNDTG